MMYLTVLAQFVHPLNFCQDLFCISALVVVWNIIRKLEFVNEFGLSERKMNADFIVISDSLLQKCI